MLFAQLVVGMLGVLAFSGEYGTGMIRATLAVVPARLPVLWAKVIVLAAGLPVSMLCAFLDYFTAAAIDPPTPARPCGATRRPPRMR